MYCYDVTPCSLVDTDQHYQPDYCLLLHPEEGKRFLQKERYLSNTKWNYIPEDYNVNDLLFAHIIHYMKRFIRSAN